MSGPGHRRLTSTSQLGYPRVVIHQAMRHRIRRLRSRFVSVSGVVVFAALVIVFATLVWTTLIVLGFRVHGFWSSLVGFAAVMMAGYQLARSAVNAYRRRQSTR